MKRITYLLLIILVMASCKSTKHTSSKLPSVTKTTQYLSSKVQFSVPGSSMNVNGTMKMKTGDRIQLSLLMPILRTEVVRIEGTPNDVLLIDRMGKQYVKTTFAELSYLLPTGMSFEKLEKILLDSSQPGGKTELTTTDLGLPYVSGARMKLSDFSDKEFEMSSATISDKYKQVTIDELIGSILGQ